MPLPDNFDDIDDKPGSDRTFGLVFAVFFCIVAAAPLWSHGAVRGWALGLAGLFLVAAIASPRALAPLNRAWARLGRLLNRIVSPLALAVLYYGAVVPTGLLMRLARKDPLRLRIDRAAATYWMERAPPGPQPESLKNQY
jgi:hypothetical protein